LYEWLGSSPLRHPASAPRAKLTAAPARPTLRKTPTSGGQCARSGACHTPKNTTQHEEQPHSSGGGAMSMRKAALFAVSLAVVAAALIGIPRLLQSQGSGFQLVEATIEDVHRAIQDGSLTC